MPLIQPKYTLFSSLASFIVFSLFFSVTSVGNPSKTLRVGVYQNEPKIFVNQLGKPDGFFVHLLDELSNKIGFSIEYVPLTWEEGMAALRTGEIDLMPDVILTNEREKEFLFNNITVLENWASLYIPDTKEPEYFTLQDLSNMTIAYMEGDSNFDAFKLNLGPDTSNLVFLPLPSYPLVMEALDNKQADVGLVNYYFGKSKSNQYRVQQLNIVVNPASVHWASGKLENRKVLNKIDEELCRLKDDKESVYYALVDNWLDPESKFKFPRWLSWLLSGLVLFFFISLVTLSGLQLRLKRNKENLREANSKLEQKITEKTEVENSLRKRNSELATTNQAMDQLVYRVSHNLRAPLSSVLGLIGVIKLEIPASASQYMQAMEKSIHQLDGIIRDILDYYQNNRTKLAHNTIDLQKLIQETYSSMAYMHKDVHIPLQLSINQKVNLVTDRLRLGSVIHNLISNALKYYNPYANEHFVAINAEVNDQQLCLTISDNGIGIPAGQQEKVFGMFFRGATVGSGAGLGLYIVQETVDKLGGKIRLKSEPNQGTTFTLQVPNFS